MAISPAFALGKDNRNLLLIGTMFISPVVVLVFSSFDRSDFVLFLFLSSILVFPFLLHPDTMRWSTVLYSIMFGLTATAYKQLLRQRFFSVFEYTKALKSIIYAYFIVLLIQQFCVLSGLPIINLSNYDNSHPWKLNSLSAEPSHSSRILGLLMYSYIIVKERVHKRAYDLRKDGGIDKWLWLAFFWTMFTTGSATSLVFILIVMIKVIRLNKSLLVGAVVFTAVFFMGNGNFSSLNRVQQVLVQTLTFNEGKILEADHSGAMRIVPIIVVARRLGLGSMNEWFGYGIDHTATFLSNEIPGLTEGSSGGGVFQIWMEYGFISFILFLVYSIFMIYERGRYLNIILWFLLVFMYGVNNQMVWLCMLCLFTNKYLTDGIISVEK